MPTEYHLHALFELSRALSSSLELEDVLRAFVARAAELVGATRGHVSTWDRERDLLLTVTDCRAADGVSGEVDLYVASEYPASMAVLESQEPLQVRVSDPAADPQEVALLDELGFRSLLMLPLVSRGETIGLVEITDERDREFSAEDVELCRAVCDLLASALHNALLYERTRELAMRDVLTGLPNRRAFDAELAAACERAARDGAPVALVLLDLDGLKRINDAGGHHVGDAALRAAADALRASVREGDVACRISGDEFGVILPGAAAAAGAAVAARAQRHLAAAGWSFSAGVAGAPAASPDRLLRDADAAVYRSKVEGGGRTSVSAAPAATIATPGSA